MSYLVQPPVTVFASAARTATVTSSEMRPVGGLTGNGRGSTRGLCVIVDVTALSLTPSVTFAIETSSGPADAYASVLTSAAVTAIGSTVLLVHPLVPTERANVLDTGPLETKWRMVATHGDTDSITYSVIAFPLG